MMEKYNNSEASEYSTDLIAQLLETGFSLLDYYETHDTPNFEPEVFGVSDFIYSGVGCLKSALKWGKENNFLIKDEVIQKAQRKILQYEQMIPEKY